MNDRSAPVDGDMHMDNVTPTPAATLTQLKLHPLPPEPGGSTAAGGRRFVMERHFAIGGGVLLVGALAEILSGMRNHAARWRLGAPDARRGDWASEGWQLYQRECELHACLEAMEEAQARGDKESVVRYHALACANPHAPKDSVSVHALLSMYVALALHALERSRWQSQVTANQAGQNMLVAMQRTTIIGYVDMCMMPMLSPFHAMVGDRAGLQRQFTDVKEWSGCYGVQSTGNLSHGLGSRHELAGNRMWCKGFKCAEQLDAAIAYFNRADAERCGEGNELLPRRPKALHSAAADELVVGVHAATEQTYAGLRLVHRALRPARQYEAEEVTASVEERKQKEQPRLKAVKRDELRPGAPFLFVPAVGPDVQVLPPTVDKDAAKRLSPKAIAASRYGAQEEFAQGKVPLPCQTDPVMASVDPALIASPGMNSPAENPWEQYMSHIETGLVGALDTLALLAPIFADGTEPYRFGDATAAKAAIRRMHEAMLFYGGLHASRPVTSARKWKLAHMHAASIAWVLLHGAFPRDRHTGGLVVRQAFAFAHPLVARRFATLTRDAADVDRERFVELNSAVTLRKALEAVVEEHTAELRRVPDDEKSPAREDHIQRYRTRVDRMPCVTALMDEAQAWMRAFNRGTAESDDRVARGATGSSLTW